MKRRMGAALHAAILVLCASISPSLCGAPPDQDRRGIAVVRNAEEPAQAAAKAKGTGWAVLIGINDYTDAAGIGRLKYCENDARILHNLLTTTGGFPKDNCRLLLGQAERPQDRPTRSNMYSVLTSWLSLAKEDDVALVFFAGHGIESEQKSYLLPQDARVTNPELTGIPLEHVKDFLRKSKADRKVLIVDACHSGEGRDLGTMKTDWADNSKGLVCIASCDIGQKSYEYDGKYQGAFSWFLKEGLGGEADRDSDGFIRASELNLYVNDKVSRWAAQRGVKQTPKFVASVIGDPVLAWCPKPPGAAPLEPAVAPTPPAPVRDPNRLDLIVLKTGRTVECEAMEVGNRIMWKRSGMTSWFNKEDVLEVRYGAGSSKTDIEKAKEARIAAAKEAEQSAVWECDFLRVELVSAEFYRKGRNAACVLIGFRFSNLRRDGADLRDTRWRGLVLVTPDKGDSQTLGAPDWGRIGSDGTLAKGVPFATKLWTGVFQERPNHLSITFEVEAEGFQRQRVKFPRVSVSDARE